MATATHKTEVPGHDLLTAWKAEKDADARKLIGRQIKELAVGLDANASAALLAELDKLEADARDGAAKGAGQAKAHA